MKSKEEFKTFVKKHPELIKYVKSGEMSWQKFYELYSLYDEDNEVWREYFDIDRSDDLKSKSISGSTQTNFGMTEIMNMFKNIKPEVLQQNINSIQKFLGFVSDFVADKNPKKQVSKGIYTPRPTKRMFED